MEVTRLADGLWRWTALHPDWKPGDGGPDGWEQEVSCVYLEAPDHVVLVDPLVPGDERDRFFEALDRDVERARRPSRSRSPASRTGAAPESSASATTPRCGRPPAPSESRRRR